MPSIDTIDPIGARVILEKLPRRIISLVPSQTELLADLGLNEEVVGITRFCVHPDGWLKEKTKVGGTKNVNPKRVKSLQPDLILANKEENVKDQIEALREVCPVWNSDVKTVEDVIRLIEEVGVLTGRTLEAELLKDEVEGKLKEVPERKEKRRGLYLIWKDPWMAAGGDTFINEMMELAGLRNVLHEVMRYPELDLLDLEHDPEVVLLSSEPYPFNQTHIAEIRDIFPEAIVVLVDGEMFSWYGSRLKYALPYLKKIGKQWGAF